MRFLITGVSGFVGAHLAPCLARRGHRVAGTYIGQPPRLEGVELFEADLLETAGLAAAVERARPEVIIHLAGLSHVGESWKAPGAYFQVNVLGTENLLRSAGEARLVLASSAEVYGLVPAEEQPIPEDRQVAPQSPYALTKAAAERLVLLRGGLVVRSFNLVGPGQPPKFAIPAFATQLAEIRRGERKATIEVGNLSARRDFLHVDDGVAAYALVAERGERGGVYNLGGGEARSIGEVLDALRSVSGVESRVAIDPDRFRPVDLPVLTADNRRLRDLGWAPERSLDAALADLWRSLDPAPAPAPDTAQA